MTLRLAPAFRAKLQEAAEIQATVAAWDKEEIVRLPFTDFALVCRQLKSQSYGSLGERWVCNYLDLERAPGNLPYDAFDDVGRYEIKYTLSSATGQFNVVQIRLFSEVDYLILGVNSDNTGQLWMLTHDQMSFECDTLRAGSAHGKRDKSNPNQELRLSFSEGDSTYHRWNRLYLWEPVGVDNKAAVV